MAEVIGVIASVAQLAHLSGTLLVGGYGFLSMATRAPKEIRSLLTETAAINSILAQLQELEDDKSKDQMRKSLQALEKLGIFEECHATLQFVQVALSKCQEEAGKDLKNFGKRLKWPFKESETKDALDRMHRLRGITINAVELDSAKSLHRIETTQLSLVDDMKGLNMQTQAKIGLERKEKVLAWLCPTSTAGQHNSLESALARRLPGTGAWFLESHVFKWWSTRPHSSLWITGLPGSGKTLLFASSIQKVNEMKSKDDIVLFFFCDHRDLAKRSHEHFVTSILRQMLDLSTSLMGKAEDLYAEKAKGGERPFNDLEYIPLILSFMEQFKTIYIFCDALDEALEGSEIADTLRLLLQHRVRSDAPLRLLFTSRFDVQFERQHAQITSNRLALADNMKSDITQYVNAEVESCIARGRLKLRDEALSISIKGKIASGAGTMLQARLQLDYLTSAKTDRDLKNIINTLPDGLEHTYEMLLVQTATRYSHRIQEVKTLLRCLAIASPTLTAANLAEILVMRPGEHNIDFDSVATDPYDILETIAPFLTITRTRSTDSVVKLSHFSLDEYLSSERISNSRAREFFVNQRKGNAWMASICLQYLTLDIFCRHEGDLSSADLRTLNDYSFRKYSALNWFRHYKAAGRSVGVEMYCKQYLHRLFQDSDGSPCYQNWQKVYGQSYALDEIHLYPPICFAISQGLDGVVEEILPTITDVNRLFFDEYTCLATAAKWDRADTVKRLIDLGADLEITSTKGCTPLHLAAEFCCWRSFKILIDAGANPNARSSSGTTPFYRACRGGHIGMVRKLKEMGCDINARTVDSWTPVMEAVENGHEKILDLLLEWGVDLTVRTDTGWTALLIARDGFSLAPNRRMIENLEKATPESVLRDFPPEEWEEEETKKEAFGLFEKSA